MNLKCNNCDDGLVEGAGLCAVCLDYSELDELKAVGAISVSPEEFKPCTDCKSSQFISFHVRTDGLRARHYVRASCKNPICQEKFWAENKMPQCTEDHDNEEDARSAWNNGYHQNHPFSFGGVWTGD